MLPAPSPFGASPCAASPCGGRSTARGGRRTRSAPRAPRPAPDHPRAPRTRPHARGTRAWDPRTRDPRLTAPARPEPGLDRHRAPPLTATDLDGDENPELLVSSGARRGGVGLTMLCVSRGNLLADDLSLPGICER